MFFEYGLLVEVEGALIGRISVIVLLYKGPVRVFSLGHLGKYGKKHEFGACKSIVTLSLKTSSRQVFICFV